MFFSHIFILLLYRLGRLSFVWNDIENGQVSKRHSNEICLPFQFLFYFFAAHQTNACLPIDLPSCAAFTLDPKSVMAGFNNMSSLRQRKNCERTYAECS